MIARGFIDKRTFLQLLEKEEPIQKKLNYKVKPFIDKWIMLNYEQSYLQLNTTSWITRNGLSSLDRFNNRIEDMYYSPDLSFKSQKEADEFLNRELCWKRFTIQLRIN